MKHSNLIFLVGSTDSRRNCIYCSPVVSAGFLYLNLGQPCQLVADVNSKHELSLEQVHLHLLVSDCKDKEHCCHIGIIFVFLDLEPL